MASQWRTILATGVTLLVVLAGCRSMPPAAQPPAVQPRGTLPDGRTIDTFSYSFAPAALDPSDNRPRQFWALGPIADLSVTREGKVRYSYSSAPHTGSGGRTFQKEWDVGPEEAKRLLDGLVTEGLLDAESALNFQGHRFTVSYGRWRLTSSPTSMPAGVIGRLRPYLDEARAAMNENAP